MSSYGGYYYKWTDVDIAVITFYSITLLATIVVSVLCCDLQRRFAPFARPAGKTWLLTAALLWFLTNALFTANVVVQYYWLNDYYGYDLGISAQHLYFVGSLFNLIAVASILFAQFELALGVNVFSSGVNPGRRMSAPRILAVIAFVIIAIIALARFATLEAYMNLALADSTGADRYTIRGWHLYRASLILSFIAQLLLFVFSFGVLLFTSMTPTVAGTRRARNLLIAAAVLSAVSALYSLIISGIFSLSPLTNLVIEYPYWLPALNVVFDAFLLAVVLALLLAAAASKTEKFEANQPVVWSQQAYAPPSHVQHATYAPPSHVQHATYAPPSHVQHAT